MLTISEPNFFGSLEGGLSEPVARGRVDQAPAG